MTRQPPDPFREGFPLDRMLSWTDGDGIPREMNLSRFFIGTHRNSRAKLVYRGRPLLAQQLVIALEEDISGLAKGTATKRLTALANFWTMLDRLEAEAASTEARELQMLRETGTPEAVGSAAAAWRIDGLADLPPETWRLFELSLRGSHSVARTDILFNQMRRIVDRARQIAGLPELMPYACRQGTGGPRLQSDIDREALHMLYRICLAELRRIRELPLVHYFADAPLDPEAPVPADWGASNEGCRQMVWDHVRRMNSGRERRLAQNPNEFHAGRSEFLTRNIITGVATQSMTDYLALLVPDKAEALAAWIVVASRNGWLDALSGFDLSKAWVQELRPSSLGSTPRPRFRLIGQRPKTGGFVSCISTCGTYAPHAVLRRQEARSQLLRDVVAAQAGDLAGMGEGLDPQGLRDLHRLQGIAVSPFAYSDRRLGHRAARLFADEMRGYRVTLEVLLARAGAPLLDKLDPDRRKNLVERILALKLSDLRDAALDRVWVRTRSLYAVQAAAGHAHVSTTEIYFRRNQWRLERFRAYGETMGILGEEILAGETPDPVVLFARKLIGAKRPLDPALRARLKEGSLGRSRAGIPCADPYSPPAMQTRSSARCTLDLCVLCRNGILADDVPGVFETLARRNATLRKRIAAMPAQDVLGSLEDFELAAIEAAVDMYYPERRQEFGKLSKTARTEEIRHGRI